MPVRSLRVKQDRSGNEKKRNRVFEISSSPKNSEKQESCRIPLQKRRRRVALVFLLICATCFVLLGLQSKQEKGVEDTSALEYLAQDRNIKTADPLGLIDCIPELRLVGVSADTNILGYESDLPAKGISQKVIMELETKGWQLDKDSDISSGFINMYQVSVSGSQASYILIQVIDLGAGSSIVISGW